MKQVAMHTLQDAALKGTNLGRLLDEILGRRGECLWPVSLAVTALTVRRMMPNCNLHDRDLADMIAIHAVEHGRDVIFDADLLAQS